MTRRSFCFLFGAGVAGLAVGGLNSSPVEQINMRVWVDFGGRHIDLSDYLVSVDFGEIDRRQRDYVDNVLRPLAKSIEIGGFFS